MHKKGKHNRIRSHVPPSSLINYHISPRVDSPNLRPTSQIDKLGLIIAIPYKGSPVLDDEIADIVVKCTISPWGRSCRHW